MANDLRLRRIFNPLHLFSYLNSWERASIFPFDCSVLNKGTTGTIFITSFVWRGPWLGIEPGSSRTRSQHSTTRLSRRFLTGDWTRYLPYSKPALYHKAIKGEVLDWGLNPVPPELEASTLPLAYQVDGPWLGIEPGTSCTRSQHYTTRLSRRRFHSQWYTVITHCL